MSSLPQLRCTGCGAVLPATAPAPFRCPRADDADDRDHVMAGLVPRVPHAPLASPAPCDSRTSPAWTRDAASQQPFVRYRERLWPYAFARAQGMGDAEFVECVLGFDDAAARLGGHGLRVSPLTAPPGLNTRLGGMGDAVWVKDETQQLGGSHKGRHLFGLALVLEVQERTGLATRAENDRRGLAIASCGNAALAAAIIARAAARPLRVFIPPDAEPAVVRDLKAFGAEIIVCARTEGVPGDPCMSAFRAAVRAGAIPFCCQGSDNGLTLEGGKTLGFELAEALQREHRTLDRLFIQVGGGALASSCIDGLIEAVECGALAKLPRLHAVQPAVAWPLRRAWERFVARVHAGEPASAALEHARTHRSRYMWAWEPAPTSIAHGILDDETYDWLGIVAGMHASGGSPVTVSEARLLEANALARDTTPIRADATGTAGLAGLLELNAAGAIRAGESSAVLFTGAER